MFIDYYALLGIPSSASTEEIKKAFRRKAFEWHPDRNISEDAKEMMQLLNEAFLILKDQEARNRYDGEYQKFQESKWKSEINRDSRDADTKEDYKHESYNIQDEQLKQWIINAKAQAAELAMRTIEELKGVIGAGASGAAEGILSAIGKYLGMLILFTIIFGMMKACS
jgi:curved DNA-binding protein CbpA